MLKKKTQRFLILKSSCLGVCVWGGAIGNNFLPVDDNVRPHRAALVTDYLEGEGIQRMEWLVYSPDLNPIDCVGDVLANLHLGNPLPSPRTLQKLQGAIHLECTLLPQALLDNQIHSMKNHSK